MHGLASDTKVHQGVLFLKASQPLRLIWAIVSPWLAGLRRSRRGELQLEGWIGRGNTSKPGLPTNSPYWAKDILDLIYGLGIWSCIFATISQALDTYTSVCDEKPNSILETRTRISFFQSHVWDENENFFLSISCFEASTRISIFNLRLWDENENRDWDNSRENF